ncbi:MAG: Methyltransferase FkbM family [candidate division TM6 bacterium GW2011_GWF2_32_72]|nr:MAG: Methyltransferase FkbM family [candidate division TM6 bacterium GW2011_GWF2_32_72]
MIKKIILLILFSPLISTADDIESNILTKDCLIFDIGANHGAKAKEYLEFASKIVCVEPQKKCIEKLQQAFKGCSKIEIIHAGLADKEGELDFYECPTDTISTFTKQWQTGRFKGFYWKPAIKVPVTTLDNLIEKYGNPKFCKIDVEGFELNVLKGLSKPIEWLSFEFTAEFFENAKKCLDHLESLGYKSFNFVSGAGNVFTLTKFCEKQEMIEIIEKIILKKFDGIPLTPTTRVRLVVPLWGDIYAHYDEK